MTTDALGVTNQSFFNPAQAHVGESAQSALAATNMPSPNAMGSSCGTALPVQPERMSKEGWSQQTAFPSVSTGKSQKDAQPQATQTGTGAPDAESQGTELKHALEQRRLEPLSPYRREAWTAELSHLGLLCKYPSVIQGFANGFNLGIPPIRSTYAPENHHSVQRLLVPYNDIVEHEFATGRYISPFTREQVEANLGPFQTSPLSLVPKTSKPGKFQAMHNFSHPHNPLPEATSINSQIDGDNFPCTWGTFTAVALLIAHLPPDSQASVRDVAEAYRTIPIAPSQWPGLVIRLQPENQFAINVCNNFGLTSAGGVYGSVADAGADIFRGNGIGLLAKWVDDHIFFRIPRVHLPKYNARRADWCQEIRSHGGRRQNGSRLWYGGKNLPNGSPEEFDEDCSATLHDLADASPRATEDQVFAYAEADINALSKRLGIRWEVSKSVPFGTEVPYLGFRWNLRTRIVYLLEEKKEKYLAAIAEWESKRTHNLLETQKLYGKLLHASLVMPAGRSHLTSLEAMLGSFDNRIFLPHTPPRDTPGDLEWWKQQLNQPEIARPIPEPQPLVDYDAYSDASSGFGVAITIGPKWRTW